MVDRDNQANNLRPPRLQGAGVQTKRQRSLLVRRPRAQKVDHSKFTFTSPSKKENSSCLGRIPSEKPRFVCLPVQTRAVWPNGGVLSSPSSCTSCYGNQVDACDQGFVSTMLCLKFRSDGYPSCVWGLCSSSEDSKARLGVGCRSRRSWTVGSIQRARIWEVSVARRPCPPRPDVRLSPRQ